MLWIFLQHQEFMMSSKTLNQDNEAWLVCLELRQQDVLLKHEDKKA